MKPNKNTTVLLQLVLTQHRMCLSIHCYSHVSQLILSLLPHQVLRQHMSHPSFQVQHQVLSQAQSPVICPVSRQVLCQAQRLVMYQVSRQVMSHLSLQVQHQVLSQAQRLVMYQVPRQVTFHLSSHQSLRLLLNVKANIVFYFTKSLLGIIHLEIVQHSMQSH